MSDEKVWRGWAVWFEKLNAYEMGTFGRGPLVRDRMRHLSGKAGHSNGARNEEILILPAADYDALLTDNTNLFQCAEDWRVQYEEAHERENELQDKVNALLRELTTARTALAEREAELKIAWDDDAEYQEQQARIIALEAENTRLRAELTEMKGQSNV